MEEEKDRRRRKRPCGLLLLQPCCRCWSAAGRKPRTSHFRNSRVEFLKGLRALIDDRIAHLATRSARVPT